MEASGQTYQALAENANRAGLQANKEGHVAEALEHFKEAARLVPKDPRFLLSAANMCQKQGIASRDSDLLRESLEMYGALAANPNLAEHPRLAEMAAAKCVAAEQALRMLTEGVPGVEWALEEWASSSPSSPLPTPAPTSSSAQLPPPQLPLPLPPPPPLFPTIDVSSLGIDGSFQPLQVNSRVPVPIETALFSGCALFLVRPEPEAADTYYMGKVFRGRRRRFEVQVQGRFKAATPGGVFTGGEVELPQMQLGLLTKGVARGVLSLISAVLPIHFSFGNPSLSQNAERPHIVSNLMIAADRMIVTPAGEAPPPLGTDATFDLEDLEDNAARKRRRQLGAIPFEVGPTYTFSFNTSNLDLPTWKMVGVPFSGTVDLHNFWQDGALRIVCYHLRPKSGAKAGASDAHQPASADYAFAIRIAHVDPATRAAEAAEASLALSREASPSSPHVLSDDAPLDGEPMAAVGGELWELVDPRESRRSHPDGREREGSPLAEEEDGVEEDDVDRASYKTADEFDDAVEELAATAGTPRAPGALPPPYLRGGAGSVPARIDVQMRGLGGSHTSLLLVVVESTVMVLSQAALMRLLPRKLWNASEKAAVAWNWSPRLHSAERQRRVACYALDTWLATFERSAPSVQTAFSTTGALPLLQAASGSGGLSDEFLSHLESPPASTASARLEGAALLAESEAYLREERIALVFPSWRSSEAYLTIGRGKTLITVPLASIISCAAKESTAALAGSGLMALEIGTLARVHVLLIAGLEARDTWLQAILGSLPMPLGSFAPSTAPESSAPWPPPSTMPATPRLNEPWKEAAGADPKLYLHKSHVFRCAERRVLNCRRVMWRGLSEVRGADACALVAQALRVSCELCALHDDETVQGQADLYERLTCFFDLTCELKHIVLESLETREQQLSFFLNLYHLLINHSYLLLGPPPSKFAWLSYFTTIAYHVGDELISLAGLEHNILRSAMSTPSSLIGGLIIPQSRYSCALTTAEPRLNFALNCGSLSSPPCVPVYTPERLDAQLEAVTRSILTENVSVGADGKLYLPIVLQLFSRDFGVKGAKASAAELARYVAARVDDESLARRIWSVLQATGAGTGAWGAGPSIRYGVFEFRCRTLAVLSDAELGLQPG